MKDTQEKWDYAEEISETRRRVKELLKLLDRRLLK